MRLQIVQRNEFLVANVALKGPFPRVNVDVPLVIARLMESLVAYRAMVSLVIGVAQSMPCQTGHAQKCFTALRAHEILFARVRFHVQF